MRRETTINSIPFAEAGKKNWFLSVKSASPKQTLSVCFADGKEYKYLGTGKVAEGNPVVIDYGGATSYMMGNVVKVEDGIKIKRDYALRPLFTFSTDPGKTEIRSNVIGMQKLEEIEDVFNQFSQGENVDHSEEFRIVDFLILGVLNALTVIAYPDLSPAEKVVEAKAFLAEEKPIPGIVFGRAFTDKYYGEIFAECRYAEFSEVILTGHYPGWKEDLLSCGFWESEEFKNLEIDTDWNNEETAYFLYFYDGSNAMEKYFSECEEFRAITNELVFRSALSVLIRGGFTNLLKAALSVEMPIKSFYQKLIQFADEIGSTECGELLKSTDYENKTFEPLVIAKKETSSNKDFIIKDNTLVKYKGNEETVVIPDGVKVIGESAFDYNKTVKKIVISNTVTRIKDGFTGCIELEEVVFGKNVSTLSSYCFSGCKKLASIDLSNTKVKTISEFAFYCCEGLKSIDLSNTKVTTIKGSAFMDSGLEHVQLPSSLQKIESYAFSKTKIDMAVIPSSVTEIGEHPFGLEGSLKRIVFEGRERIRFNLIYVDDYCVIVCEKGSELMKMLEEQNAEWIEVDRRIGSSRYAPRKLEVK